MSGINRRQFLKGLGTLGAGYALASGLPLPLLRAIAQSEFDWTMFAGDTVRFIGAGGGNEAFIESVYKDFAAQTGVDLIFENYQQEQGRQKYRIELQAGQGTVSSWMTSMINEGPQFAANGWYEPLENWVASEFTDPDWDLDDFLPGVINGMKLNGTLYAVPLNVDFHVLYYRKDLFEEAGLNPPATMDDMMAAAEALHNPPSQFGIALRGAKGHCVPMFASAFHDFGADYLDENGAPALDTSEALAAYEWWGDITREYGPEGASQMQFSTMTELFAAGRVAMIADSATFLNNVVDPELSIVYDKVGFVAWPAGPVRDTPTIFVNGLPMASTAENKEATWFFQQWMTSKEMAVQSYLAGLGQTRASVIEDPRTEGALPPDFAEAANHALANGDAFWIPQVLRIPETRDVIGNVVVVAIEGGDVKGAAQEANEQLKELLAEAQ